MVKDRLAIINVPLSVMSFLRNVSDEDKDMVIFTLFWALTDTFENMDLSEGSYEGLCCSQFAGWAQGHYLEMLNHNCTEEEDEYYRLFDVFAEFNTKVNNAKIWRTLGLYFYRILDRYDLVNDDTLYDIEVDSKRRLIRLIASTD